jgi:hypothetical protein
MGGKECFLFAKIIFVYVFMITVFANPYIVSAQSGVGVGTGKIILDSQLKAATTYLLPSVAVYNTGDEQTTYEMEVTFNERQSQLKPDSSWVEFTPKRFTLKANESQQVNMSISVPEDVMPGDYYAYLEAHTITPSTTDSGQNSTNISAAAAAKFYFSVDTATAGSNSSADTTTESNTLNTNQWYIDTKIFEALINRLILPI